MNVLAYSDSEINSDNVFKLTTDVNEVTIIVTENVHVLVWNSILDWRLNVKFYSKYVSV